MNQVTQQVKLNAERDEAIQWAQRLHFIRDNLWMIAAITFVVALLGAAYAFLSRPIYEASILIQVEESTGQSKNALGDMTNVFDVKTAVGSEMEILRSHMVVSRAVDNTHLYIDVQPKYLPGIGSWIARHNKKLSTPGLFGYGGYVWGAERADVSTFNVPEELEGIPFTLTAEGNDGFSLSQQEHGIEIKGRVGDTIKVSIAGGAIELRVDRLYGNPGAQFDLRRAPDLLVVEGLQNRLRIAERGKQSGIISASLDGTDPKVISAVLNEIGHAYVRQNAERKSEEAEKSLAFLNNRLPDLKRELEQAELKYNHLREMHGTVDLGEESKSMLQRSASVQAKLAELRAKRDELSTRFQDEHPAIVAINQQIRTATREFDDLDAKMKKLPSVEQEMLRMSRELKSNTELYSTLLSAHQQLRLATASKVGSVRLLDTATIPRNPIKPKRSLMIVVTGMIGLVLGIACAYVRKIFSGRIDSPHEVEQILGLQVSATIPYSDCQKELLKESSGKTKKLSVLSHQAPSDGAVESLRSFRSVLQYAMPHARNRIVMITGPTPGVGKSFVSANFAAVLADIGKKVLLIDADLRTGELHRYFGLERKSGLSDAIKDEAILDQVIHRNVSENVDFISTGNLPPKPAEVLANGNFGRILNQLSARYDFVLIDTPPVLLVSDALVVGAHAGTIFNIVRGGQSTSAEIEEAIKRLNQAGHTVAGTVFNHLKPRHARYGYGVGYGAYH